MRVLVTGGAGMVGSHVSELLEARGDEVITVDNFTTGRPEHLINLIKADKIQVSISNDNLIDELASRYSHINAIVHTAASFANGNDWSDHINTNILGTALITRLAQKYNSRLIYFKLLFAMALIQPLSQCHWIIQDNQWLLVMPFLRLQANFT